MVDIKFDYVICSGDYFVKVDNDGEVTLTGNVIRYVTKPLKFKHRLKIAYDIFKHLK